VKLQITLLFSVVLVLGCSSYRLEEGKPTEVAVSELEIGDTVEIVTADAEKLRFTIEVIDDDALIGNDVRVLKSDIRLVSVKRIDPGKTTGAGLSAVFIVVGVLMLVGFAALAP
jgi:hypothetical protein